MLPGCLHPKPVFAEGAMMMVWALLAAIVITCVHRPMGERKRQMATGERFPVFWTGLGLIIGLPLIAYFVMGQPISAEYPVTGNFGPRGGMQIIPEFIALVLALSTYTSAFIAEIVRAGILAVNKGQTEAAYALGLRARANLAAGDHSPGAAGHHSAADQPVSEPDQELVAGGGNCLSGFDSSLCRYGAEPDRAGSGNSAHDHADLSGDLADHVTVHELVQFAHGAGGAIGDKTCQISIHKPHCIALKPVP